MLTMVFSGGFKKFKSTLMRIKIQTGSSSGHFKKLSIQSQRPKSKWSLKYFKIRLSQLWDSNFGGGSASFLKNTEDKALNVDLYKCEGHPQLKHESQIRRRWTSSWRQC